MQLQQNTNTKNIPILMLDNVDHTTPKLGLSLNVQISKNCGGFITASGSINEMGLGWYCLSGHIQDTNTLGSLIIHASGANADMFDSIHEVVAFNPNDPISMGMSFSNGVVVSGIQTSVQNNLADNIMVRQASNWQNSASGLCMGAVILENLNSAISGNSMTIYKSDGTTPLMYRAITKTSDNPIRGIQ